MYFAIIICLFIIHFIIHFCLFKLSGKAAKSNYDFEDKPTGAKPYSSPSKASSSVDNDFEPDISIVAVS